MAAAIAEFTESELEMIEKMATNRHTIEEIAAALDLHPTSVERRLLMAHDIKLERVRAVRLTPLPVYRSRQKAGRRQTYQSPRAGA